MAGAVARCGAGDVFASVVRAIRDNDVGGGDFVQHVKDPDMLVAFCKDELNVHNMTKYVARRLLKMLCEPA